MTDLRKAETRLAKASLVGLAIFAPLETIASWQMFGGPQALIHPGYFGSVAGMILLYVGATRSLHARPHCAPAVLCASLAWWAGVGWHAASIRLSVLREGDQLFYGSPELWAVTAGAVLAAYAFGRSLFFTYKAEPVAAAGAAARGSDVVA